MSDWYAVEEYPCPNCGRVNEDYLRHCAGCGEVLDREVERD